MITIPTPRPKDVKLAVYENNDLKTIWVKLDWHCPVCFKLRGQLQEETLYHSFTKITCNTWTNPCGHIESNKCLLAEAKRNGYNDWQFYKIPKLTTHTLNATL